MPALDTSRKQLSQVVVQDSPLSAGAYTYATVTVKGDGTKINPIGTAVVYSKASTGFVAYATAAQIDNITSPATVPDATTLPNNKAFVGVTVGTSQGIGFNEGDVTLDNTDGVVLWVAFRDAVVDKGGIEWIGTVTAPNQAAFVSALESQGVSVIDKTVIAQPKFV